MFSTKHVLKYRFIFADLLLFHQICYKKSCIELPDYYSKYSEDERKRLRSVIKPPNYYGGSTLTLNLQKPRETKNSELSLKCTLSKINLKYKSSFFFRTVQEWNRLLLEIREEENFGIFKTKLYDHLNKEAFAIEPDLFENLIIYLFF